METRIMKLYHFIRLGTIHIDGWVSIVGDACGRQSGKQNLGSLPIFYLLIYSLFSISGCATYHLDERVEPRSVVREVPIDEPHYRQSGAIGEFYATFPRFLARYICEVPTFEDLIREKEYSRCTNRSSAMQKLNSLADDYDSDRRKMREAERGVRTELRRMRSRCKAEYYNSLDSEVEYRIRTGSTEVRKGIGKPTDTCGITEVLFENQVKRAHGMFSNPRTAGVQLVALAKNLQHAAAISMFLHLEAEDFERAAKYGEFAVKIATVLMEFQESTFGDFRYVDRREQRYVKAFVPEFYAQMRSRVGDLPENRQTRRSIIADELQSIPGAEESRLAYLFRPSVCVQQVKISYQQNVEKHHKIEGVKGDLLGALTSLTLGGMMSASLLDNHESDGYSASETVGIGLMAIGGGMLFNGTKVGVKGRQNPIQETHNSEELEFRELASDACN